MEGKTSAGHILIWNGGTSIILLQHNGLSELLMYWCLQTFSVNYISLKMITSLHFAQHLNAFGNGGLYIEVPNCSFPLKNTISKSNVNFNFCFFFFKKYLRQNVNSPKNDVNIDDHKHASSKCFHLWNTTGQDVCLRFYCLMFGVMCFGACINEFSLNTITCCISFRFWATGETVVEIFSC